MLAADSTDEHGSWLGTRSRLCWDHLYAHMWKRAPILAVTEGRWSHTISMRPSGTVPVAISQGA